MKKCFVSVLLCLVMTGLLEAADLEVGKERILRAKEDIGVPRAALGKGICLVVWREGWPGMGGSAQILGLRLRASTLQALDARPIQISSSLVPRDRPSVVFADGKFLVAWENFGNGKDGDIEAAFLDPESGLLTHSSLRIAAGQANQARPHACPAQNGFFIVWQEGNDRGTYQIRGRKILSSGELADPVRIYAAEGACPQVASNGNRILVSWTTGTSRGEVSASLLAATSGEVEKLLGVINSSCAEGLAVSPVGKGSFWTVAARESFPNPWGWPGPGAVTFSRVLEDGSSPEGNLDYGRRLTKLSERTVPNVVDAATWGSSGIWNAGVPGGFPGTKDGLWPHGMPSIADDGQGNVFFAWVKGLVGKDRLSLSNFDIWVTGIDTKTLQTQFKAVRAAGEKEIDELLPFFVSVDEGRLLLVYVKVGREIQRQLAIRELVANKGG